MWLLDANMDVHLVQILASYGIIADTASNRGWKALSNGQLVAAAVTHGFTCLLTRDRLFGETAGHALKAHPDFAIVLVNLPQQRSDLYHKRFIDLWSEWPVEPKPGQLTEWPLASSRKANDH
jgi:hypothetical protein